MSPQQEQDIGNQAFLQTVTQQRENALTAAARLQARIVVLSELLKERDAEIKVLKADVAAASVHVDPSA